MQNSMLERCLQGQNHTDFRPFSIKAITKARNKFDMVISDKGMPNMTGVQLAGELISIRPDIPIIICTGFSNE